MPSNYARHYEDAIDRKAENTDLVQRLQVIDSILGNIPTTNHVPQLDRLENNLSSTLSKLSLNVGSQVGTLLAPFIPKANVNDIQAIDLFYLLGAVPWGNENPYPEFVEISGFNEASWIPQPPNTGKLRVLTPAWQGDFLYATTNQTLASIILSFKTGKVIVDGIAIQIGATASQRPRQLIVWGYNTGQLIQTQLAVANIPTTLTTGQWFAIAIDTNQTISVNPNGYEFIRISSTTLNGSNYNISGQMLKLYGRWIA